MGNDQNSVFHCKKEQNGKKRSKKTDPIPRVPPVTRAVIPLRDHLEALLELHSSATAIYICLYLLALAIA
jgi:hypothetical protein